jgi:hypothetical protein
MKANADMIHTTDGYGVRVGGTKSAIGDGFKEISIKELPDDPVLEMPPKATFKNKEP